MDARRTTLGRHQKRTSPENGITRRDVLSAASGGAVGGAVLAGSLNPLTAGSEDKPAGGSADNALEFVGRLLQDGGRFTGFGYATAARGLDPEALFEDPAAPSESGALLTIFSESTLLSIARVNGVFAVRAAGSFRLYLRDGGGADFADPASFAVGTLIADARAVFHNTLTVTDPNQGLAHIVASLTLKKAHGFALKGHAHRFGARGAQARLTAVGKGLRTDADLPAANFDLGGYVTLE